MILVDRPRRVTPTKAYPYTTAFHIVSTVDVDELCAFAEQLGLREAWLQTHRIAHFDAIGSKHSKAIALGARLVTTREIVRRACRGQSRPQANPEQAIAIMEGLTK